MTNSQFTRSRSKNAQNSSLLMKRRLAFLLSGVAVTCLAAGSALAQTTHTLGDYAPDHYTATGPGQYLPGNITNNPDLGNYGQNDNQGGQWEVNNGAADNVLNGSYSTVAPGRGNTVRLTLRQIADLDDANLDDDTLDPNGFGGGRIDPADIADGTGTRFVTGNQNHAVEYIDPVTGDTFTVNVYETGNLKAEDVEDTYFIWHKTQDQEAYLDPRLATVSNGSTLEVTIGDADGATTDAGNVLNLHSKASPSTTGIISAYKVEDTAELEYATNTRVDFGEYPTPTATGENSVSIENVLFNQGVEIDEDFTWTNPDTGLEETILAGPVDSEARLHDYNNYLIHLIETGDFRTKFGLPDDVTSDTMAAKYRQLIHATYEMSDPIVVTYTEAFKPKPIQDMPTGERTMFHGVDGSTTTINAGQTIEDVTSGGGHSIAYLENDATLVNNGTLASSYTEHGVYATDDAQVTNNGVISNYVDGVASNHYSRAVQLEGSANLDNAGTINVTPADNIPLWLTQPKAATDSSVRQDDSALAWNYGVGVFDTATATNTGTINVGVKNSGDVTLVDGVYVESDGSFVNRGNINIGLGADGTTAVDTNTTILTGVRVLGDGKAENAFGSTITIGSNTGNAAAMYAGQGRTNAETIGTGALELINNGTIIVNGSRNGSPATNYAMYAENVEGTIEHNGTIELNGVSARGIQVLGTTTATHATTDAASIITVKGGLNVGANTRNYGVWVEGSQANPDLASANLAGTVNLDGDYGIGVHARSGGDINLDPTAGINFVSGENQIGYFIHGAGSTINNVSSTLDVSTKNSTLFRIENGASFADLVGATGGQLTASGEGATIIHVTGTGATADLGSGTYTAGGAGSIAIKVDGGAKAEIESTTNIELTGVGSTGGIVDGYKNNINGSHGTTAVGGTTLTNNAEVESNANGVIGFIARNGGVLNNNETITFTGQNTTGIRADKDGVVNNTADIRIEHGAGLVSNEGGEIHNTGAVTVTVGTGQGMVADGGYAENDATLSIGNGRGVWSKNGGEAVNSGDVTITGTGTGLQADGSRTDGTDVINSTIENSGNVTVENGQGIYVFNGGSVENTGTDLSIKVTTGTGIRAEAGGVVTKNDADITVQDGTGIYVEQTGNVTNAGDIDVVLGNGIHAVNGGTVTNTGDLIRVYGTTGEGNGAAGIISNNGNVTNGADIKVDFGTGIWALNSGVVNNTNDAALIDVGNGIGIDVSTLSKILNNSDITVGTGRGILVHNEGILTDNTGTIRVGNSGTGLQVNGLGSTAKNSGNIVITGTGAYGYGITAADSAVVNNNADDPDAVQTITVEHGAGVWAITNSRIDNDANILIQNGGVGVFVRSGAEIVNTGDTITVQGDYGYGIYADGQPESGSGGTAYGAVVRNDANIDVTLGEGIYSTNQADVFNVGNIKVASGIGINADLGSSVDNTGDIAVTNGQGIWAIDDGEIHNKGDITVQTGAGIVVQVDGEVVNSGAVNVTQGTGAYVQDGGRFQNAPSGTITVQDGTGLLVENTGGATTPANISNAADIIVNDGVAGIHVRNGASLDASAFSGTVTVDGSAHGVLVGQDATGLILGSIGIVTNGDGNGLENARELTGIQLRDTHITVNGPASGVRTGVSLAAGSSGVIDVNGAGSTGFRFELANGSSTNQNLVIGDELTINMTPSSSSAFGIVANTTGDASVATTLNDEGTDNIAVLIERANVANISSNIDVNTASGSNGTGIYLAEVNQAVVSGNVTVGANGGSALVVENASDFVANTGNLVSQSVAPVVDLSPSNGTDFLNFGTITAADYRSLAVLGSNGDDNILLGRDSSGAVSNVTGVVATRAGTDTVRWDAGTLVGSIEMGDGDNDRLTVVGRDLSTVYHLDGGAGAGDTLDLSSIVYHGGTFANDDAFGARMQGVNLGQDWENINLTDSSRFTLTGNVLHGDEMFVDKSSILYAGNNVNPLVGKPGGNLKNHGTLDLTNGVYSMTDTATVGGNYIGGPANDPSLLMLNTYLGVDSSPSDKLIVSGGTSGQTAIRILRDPSSPGALTTGDGILLVRVDQDSNSNAVFTAPSMIQGAYEYNLYKGGIVNPQDGDWYLRSYMTTSAQTTLAYGSSLLDFAKNVGSLQQRTGGRVWSNPQPQRPAETVWCKDASQNFSCTLTPEQSAVYADNTGSTTLYGAGLWARMGGDIGRNDPRQGAGYDTKSWYMQAGAEGVVSERENGLWTAGIFGTYGKQSVDVAIKSAPKTPDPSRFGSISTDAYGLAGNLTWLGNDGFYFDAVAQYMWYRSNLSSTGFGGFARDNNATGYTFSAEVGKSYNINESWAIVPQAQLAYTNVRHADFVIANPDPLSNIANIAVSGGKGSSLIGRLGARLDYKSRNEHDGKVDRVQVYGIANLYYDFLDGSEVNIGGSNLKQKNARFWGEVGVGGTFAFNDKVSLYGEARYATSLENFGKSYNVGGNVGLRYNW